MKTIEALAQWALRLFVIYMVATAITNGLYLLENHPLHGWIVLFLTVGIGIVFLRSGYKEFGTVLLAGASAGLLASLFLFLGFRIPEDLLPGTLIALALSVILTWINSKEIHIGFFFTATVMVFGLLMIVQQDYPFIGLGFLVSSIATILTLFATGVRKT